MAVRLYDTRHKSVVDIVPARAGRLSVYACGPTVYRDAPHVLGVPIVFNLPAVLITVAVTAGSGRPL